MTASNERLPESLVGRHLGAYDVLARVGAGGMGEVYRAHVQMLQTGERREILRGGDPRIVPTGHLVYALGSTLFAIPSMSNDWK